MKKIAIVLTGCGYKDGSEITETVSSMLVLSELGADITYFSLDMDVDSLSYKPDTIQEKRNLIEESLRITRDPVLNLKDIKCEDYDGVIFPGGFGAVTHLSDFSTKGSEATIEENTKRIIIFFHKESKPILGMCISPILIAKVLGKEHHVAVTIGDDKATAREIEKMGARHIECTVTDYISDRENKIITTPAYMSKAKPHQIYEGIKKAIYEFYEMS